MAIVVILKPMVVDEDDDHDDDDDDDDDGDGIERNTGGDVAVVDDEVMEMTSNTASSRQPLGPEIEISHCFTAASSSVRGGLAAGTTPTITST